MDAILREIGLTDSEQKVYRALLLLGYATRGSIVDKSGIAGSKVYEILEKLREKGLVSIYIENKIKHFKAANPKQILSYVHDRQEKLKELEEQTHLLLPKLLALYGENQEEQEVEMYTGLKGLEIIFKEQLDALKKGDYNYVIGGTQSTTQDAIVAFFHRIHVQREEKGIKTRMLFNEHQRHIVEQFYSTKEFPGTATKFITHSSPVAINIYRNTTIISIYGKTVTAIKITSEATAKSFMEHFELLWKTASA